MPTQHKINNGVIFQIQRFSLDDGPGIRTTVFLKGCNLRCAWCHNPESIHSEKELSFQKRLCIRCGACVAACPHGAQICDERGRFLNWTACTNCLQCVAACPTGALSIFGQEMSASQVLETLLRDQPFYAKSGGGVTFSGGEPLLQVEFVLEMLKLCKANNLNTAVDTAGNVPLKNMLSVLPYTDLFLFDIKAYDPILHWRNTGIKNARILSNLRQLNKHQARIWVRLPYIPGVNDGQDEIKNIAVFLKGIECVEKVELLPYHAYGEGKRELIGAVSGAREQRTPTRSDLLNMLEAYKNQGLQLECPSL